MKLKANLGADATVLLTTVIWGSTFAVARDVLDAWPPLAYLAVRMPLAALLFATHVSLTSVYARRFDIRQLSALQVVVAAALVVMAWLALRAYVAVAGFVPPAVAREVAPLAWSAPVVWQLVYLSTVATVG